MEVQPGEIIEYVILDQTGKRHPQKARSLLLYQPEDGYDVEKYTEFLLKAAETLFSPFGYDYTALQTFFKVGKKKRKRRKDAEQVQLELPLG